MNQIIEVKGLSKSFGKNKVLDDVNIGFAAQRIHGIIGRNGSGKTMLFKCILGMMPFSDGEITVNGKRIGKDIDVPEDVGMIIESPGFLAGYSGYANLRLLSRIKNVIGRDEITRAIQTVGLDPASRKRVGKYSMGMRQRLCIAQAIMENPSLLILDEPMNGLDNRGVGEIRELLLNLKNQGKTILIASHNPEDIRQLCDTVCEMDCGKLTQVQ
ncbi:MAG: ATP-binding cassette domain-containing protein [Clostridia bacterium]|nr:ATP-binding cassette domain-containing protein [Clostridia bacterium]